MPAKERLTEKAILHDILYDIKNPNDPGKAVYILRNVIGTGLLLLSMASFFLGKRVGGITVLCSLAVVVSYGIAILVIRKRRQKAVRIENYEIGLSVLSHKERERYAEFNKDRSIQTTYIIRHLLHFEDGRSFLIPESNYTWSQEYLLSDYHIYENVHRGDSLLTVTEKKTGRIAMVYLPAHFDYKLLLSKKDTI